MKKIRSAVVLLFLLHLGIVLTPSTASAQGTMFLGVVRGANTLILFNSANPSAILSSIPITGLAAGEVVRGIDIRPVNGVLYGLATPDGITTQVRLYTINPTTGQASAVGAAATVASGGNFWGMSFDPVDDRVRVVNNGKTNARLHPDTGALAANDTALSGVTFGVDAIAYDNQVAGAAPATLYGIYFGTGDLVRIGGPEATPSPNEGAVTTIGPLGVPQAGNTPIGLDWAPAGNLVAAITAASGGTGLYTIDTTTGSASLVGSIGDGTLSIDSLAVGNAGLVITPASGTYTAQQRFDMVLLLNAPGRVIVSGSAIFDGINVTDYIVSCARIGQTAAGLTTIRCANFGGPLFGPGNHIFTVNLNLDSGEVVSATVNWNVLASTEP
jgi:hypothetical protein